MKLLILAIALSSCHPIPQHYTRTHYYCPLAP